jgi:Senescence domain
VYVLHLYIHSGSSFLKARLQPREKDVDVDKSTLQRLEKARLLSGYVVQLSRSVFDGAVSAALGVADFISDRIAQTSLGRQLSKPTKPNSGMAAAKQVASTSGQALLKLVSSMETAGLQLLGEARHATVDVVAHKYGAQVGEATDHSMCSDSESDICNLTVG